MLRRKRVNRDSRDLSTPKRGGRFRNALIDAGWAVREHVFWRTGDALRGGAEIVKWPFERIAWGIRRGLIWRLEDRADSLGPVTRAVGFGAVVVLAAAAGVAGLLWAAPSHSPSETTLAQAAPAAVPEPVTPAPEPKPVATPKPTLQGAAPLFKPVENEGDKKGSAKKSKTTSPDSSPSSFSSTNSADAKPLSPVLSTSGPKSAAATASSDAKESTAVAGPKAVKVARRFAVAFVLYETGRGGKDVRKTFAETATPELRNSLLRRPPRLPANVKVPKAKVLNVVPGPARGGVYTMSVSLLRVGLTSELRLDMEPSKGKQWHVTDVLG
jgi:hypothetical protein